MAQVKDTKTLHRKHLIAGSTYLPAIISFFILIFLDQLTKYLITKYLELYDSIPIIKDVFEIHYIRNSGAAWGIFEDKQMLFYFCFILVLILGILFYIRCVKLGRFKDIRILVILVLAGGAGNFIDRIRFKYVIDFLYFKLIDFPVFNVADCYVTIGFFLMIFLLLFKYKEEDIECLTKFKKR